MEGAKEEPKVTCFENLSSIGATTELCEFIADVLQCESDMMKDTGRYHVDIGRQVLGLSSIQILTNALKKMYKSLGEWRERIRDLERRKQCLPQSISVDRYKLEKIHSFKAICSMESSEMSLKEGEDVQVTDSSMPNMLKVRNTDGKEGYIPLLSCFVPSPDLTLHNCIERLQVQLVTCWSDSLVKVHKSLMKCLITALDDLLCEIDQASLNSCSSAVQKFKGRAQLFKESLEKEQLQLKYLAKSLRSLENDYLKTNHEESQKIRQLIAEVDVPILFYLAMRDKLRSYRKELKSRCRPIRVTQLDSKALRHFKDKTVRYYEIRLTASETSTREERTYTTPKKEQRTTDADKTSRSLNSRPDVSKRCSVQSVIDPRTEEEISVKDAVALGILDHRSGSYVNPDTGDRMTIAAAISKKLIKIARTYVDKDRHDENGNKLNNVLEIPFSRSAYENNVDDHLKTGDTKTTRYSEHLPPGLITLKTNVVRKAYEISSVLDHARGCNIDSEEARKLGILTASGMFKNRVNEVEVTLDEAVKLKWLEVVGKTRNDIGMKDEMQSVCDGQQATFEVEEVFDSSTKTFVSFVEAVKRRLIDPTNSCFVDNETKGSIFPSEAIARGLIKVRQIQPGNQLSLAGNSFHNRHEQRTSRYLKKEYALWSPNQSASPI